MKVEYTEWMGITKVVDLDKFWIDHLSHGICQADKNWHNYLDTNEPYCYGRNRYRKEWEEWSEKGYQLLPKLLLSLSEKFNKIIKKYEQ